MRFLITNRCRYAAAALWLAPAAPLVAGEGAVAEPPITDADRTHWSFVPPVRVEPPELAGDTEGELGAIDRFVLARLRREGLGFAPEADRRTLVRRASFDLTGLPPSPAEVEAFVSDESLDAYPKLIDRLLASPAYGERWAQHWLDLVRFAESDGFELDKARPDAWRYRDWVIGALNDDLPYDRFVALQLAADEIAPGDPAAQQATGYLLAGPDMVDINLAAERRHVFLNGMAGNVGETFMAMTLGCAQCHDHKTDPVSIADFYRLRAIFAGAVVAPKKHRQLGATVREAGTAPPESFVMVRGDFRRPADPLSPAYLRVLNPAGATVPPPPEGAGSSMRRAAFAGWLTRPEHPLTARVIANRLWQHHFGRGLVATPGDFGRTGQAPTHPELLDWLATELPARGWSLKEMHRLMMTSRSYRQASRGEGEAWAHALAADPDRALLSRMARRRLEGEAVRDSFLAVAGRLNRKAGGPGVRPPLPREVTSTVLKGHWEVTPDTAEHDRRSIYLFARRNLRFPLFDVFDRPDSNLSCARREQSTTAPQSLTLLNSAFSLDVARAFAARLEAASPDPGGQIGAAYALLFARPPDAEERRLGAAFLQSGAAADEGTEPALTRYCLALLNTSEAIYVD